MRITQAIATFFIGVIFGAIYACTINAHSTPEPTPKTEIQYVYVEKEPEVITETVYVEKDFFRNHSEEDAWYYKDMALREGEGEGVVGMLWIMYTFECRCKAFNHTAEEEWASSAYESSMFRSGITPNEDCEKAYELFREGWIPEPLYFRAGNYHSFGTPLCEVGNHYFSTK